VIARLQQWRAYSAQLYEAPNISALLRSAPSASSSCDNCAASDVRSTTTPSPHWCTRLSSAAASTTVSVYWLLVHRRRQQTSCNASSIAARVVSNRSSKYDRCLAEFRRQTLRGLDVASPTESGSGCASKCTSVSMASRYLARAL